jgi:hypothetical protein
MREFMKRNVLPFALILFGAWLQAGAAAGPNGPASPFGLAAMAAKAPALDFHAPSFQEPYYRIHFRFEVKGEKVLLKDISLNGTKVAPYLVFSQGKKVEPGTPLEKGLYDILLDYAWSAGKSYVASLQYLTEGRQKPAKYELKGTTPKDGGIPGGQEGFCRVYTVEEEAGLGRKGETAVMTMTAPKNQLDGADLVIFDGGRAIPYEIMEKGEFVPNEKAAATHPVTTTLKIILRLDAAAHERRWLLVLKGKNPVATPHEIRLIGDGLGKTVRTQDLAIEFSPKSGQINIIEASEPGIRLHNKAGVIHWNPDVFVQGLGWDHSFDWNPPAAFEDKAGGFVYFNSRRGPLPHIKDVFLDVKYTVEAGSPYFISETRLNFEKDLGVIAVRNDEMVLDKELFDALLYKDKNGDIVKLPLTEKEGLPFGLVHTAPADIAWVGLVNTTQGYGFFSLRINAADGNLEVPGAFLHKAGTCFYAPSEGTYVYWVRPLIYTWADYFTNNLHTFVPKGSFFYEKNAYGVWRITDDLPGRLDELVVKLRNPLRLF